jgi:hypothetical protein
MPPVSDPENWNWTTFSFAPMIGFAMHNTAYRVTVQWRYWVYMKGPRGPFQTYITIYVQNLAVTSPDETKVLKWDPVRGIADTSFSYSLECAQRKWCQVKVSIYSTDGMKVYEEWLEKLAPGSYSFTWDGSVNVVPPPPPPDGKAPAGLYVFDIDVIGIAPGYDEDWLRSRALRIGEHEVYSLPYGNDGHPSYTVPTTTPLRAEYILRGNLPATAVLIETYDPDFERIVSVEGTTKTIPDSAVPQPEHWNLVEFSANLHKDKTLYPYTFVFWAWDGACYKNHLPKITITSDKLHGPQGAHFNALRRFVEFQSYADRIAQKELMFVLDEKKRPYSYGDRWSYEEFFRGKVWKLVTENNLVGWSRKKFLIALRYCTVVTYVGHGSWNRIGKIWGGEKVTIQDLYIPIEKLLCLSHSSKCYENSCQVREKCDRKISPKLVVFLGCGTGSPHPRHPKFKRMCSYNTTEAEPADGSFALILKLRGVECIIYYCGSAVAQVDDDFAERFWRYATKGLRKQDGWRKLSVAEAVKKAKSEIVGEYYRKKQWLNYECAKNIHVVGNTQLP